MFEGHSIAYRGRRHLVPCRDRLDGAFGLEAVGEHLSGDALFIDDRVAEISLRVEHDVAIMSERPPADDRVSLGKVEALVEALDPFGEEVLAVADSKGVALVADDLGEDTSAVGAEFERREGMAGAEKLMGAGEGEANLGQEDAELAERVDEAKLDEIKEAESAKAIDFGQLRGPQREARRLAPEPATHGAW